MPFVSNHHKYSTQDIFKQKKKIAKNKQHAENMGVAFFCLCCGQPSLHIVVFYEFVEFVVNILVQS